MSSTHDVTLLGTGAMGRRMVANLVAAGHRVAVWNRSHVEDDGGFLSGADRIPDAAAAAAMSPVVISMVTDDEASRALWFGEQDAARDLDGASTVIESSTISPAWTGELADRMASAGIPFLAGPVLGSTPQAQAGKLVQLIGGDASALAKAQEVLDVNAAKTVHVGGPAAAAHHKLVVNGWLAGQVALVSELLARLEQTGIDRASAAGFLAGLPLTSPTIGGVLDRMVDGDVSPKFPIGLVAKDVGYLRDGGPERTLLTALAEVWNEASAEHAELDLVGYLDAIPTD